jgi:hypothetical protein
MAAFFLIGVFNNNGFVLVLTGASSLAETFGKSDFMGAFVFTMTGISLLTRFANGTIFVNIRHYDRFLIAAGLGISAFFLISFASYKGDHHNPGQDMSGYFGLAVLASVLVGMSSSMGEATFLGYCSGFPGHVVGYVSSGTGCAGLTGTGGLLLLQAYGFSNSTIFLIASPSLLIYIASAFWLNNQKKLYPFVSDESAPTETETSLKKEKSNSALTFRNISIILPKAFNQIIFLFFVYFLEYCILSCFADRMGKKMMMLHPERSKELAVRELFVILNWCY